MKIVLFAHSIASDCNNSHAHFLRGLVAALMQRGHQGTCCEPRHNWSTKNLFATDLPTLRFMVHGVRYPKRILKSFDRTGIRYEGWVPNFAVPEVLAKSRMTLHTLRSFYCTALPGIPTIRRRHHCDLRAEQLEHICQTLTTTGG